MKTDPFRLPVVLQISAWSLGMPLVVFGGGLFCVDLLGLLRLLPQSGPPAGLVLGPVFAAVGCSLVYPVLMSPPARQTREPEPIAETDDPGF